MWNGTVSGTAITKMLEVKNVSKTINNKTILSDVSFRIEDAQIVGLLGQSGIGKSTLAKIITGLIKPDSGEILLEGGAQMVYQQPYAVLDPSQKIRDGIKELIRYHKLFPPKDASIIADLSESRHENRVSSIDRYINNIASNLELGGSVLNHLPSQISGGEAQRVALLKCLLLKPKLLILDEATSMLDVSTQANILAYVKKQQLMHGGSILMITHDHALASAYCDVLYEIDSDTKMLRPALKI